MEDDCGVREVFLRCLLDAGKLQKAPDIQAGLFRAGGRTEMCGSQLFE